MKKILAIALTLAFVLALAVPAFAAEEGNYFELSMEQVEVTSADTKGAADNYTPVHKDAEPAAQAEEPEATEPVEGEEAEETEEAVVADYEAGEKVYFMVHYHLPYSWEFDLYDEAQPNVVMDIDFTNLKDVKFFDAMTQYCLDDTCFIPSSDMDILVGKAKDLQDNTKNVKFNEKDMTITVSYPGTLSGWFVVEGTLDQTGEVKFDFTVSYGEYSEAVHAVLNEGIEVPEKNDGGDKTDDDKTNPPKTGAMTLVGVAVVSALSGAGVLSLRRKER